MPSGDRDGTKVRKGDEESGRDMGVTTWLLNPCGNGTVPIILMGRERRSDIARGELSQKRN